eukprot:TRINITY_DN15511_c0_g1_i1.p1 TRINITY_DN15511_c0_g1~~TRINITY_DN15511_c0_g1_i1.p1  ORF type:complete len:501 (-),score=118.04 TRINITY_DN15511_c0_g1_i1:114-1616(-)
MQQRQQPGGQPQTSRQSVTSTSVGEGDSHSEAFKRTKLCKFDLLGLCTRGDACSFAHGYESLRPQPDLYKTRLCSHFIRSGRCDSGIKCRYAHSQEELRQGSENGNANGNGICPPVQLASDTVAGAETISPQVSKTQVQSQKGMDMAFQNQVQQQIVFLRRMQCQLYMEGESRRQQQLSNQLQLQQLLQTQMEITAIAMTQQQKQQQPLQQPGQPSQQQMQQQHPGQPQLPPLLPNAEEIPQASGPSFGSVKSDQEKPSKMKTRRRRQSKRSSTPQEEQQPLKQQQTCENGSPKKVPLPSDVSASEGYSLLIPGLVNKNEKKSNPSNFGSQGHGVLKASSSSAPRFTVTVKNTFVEVNDDSEVATPTIQVRKAKSISCHFEIGRTRTRFASFFDEEDKDSTPQVCSSDESEEMLPTLLTSKKQSALRWEDDDKDSKKAKLACQCSTDLTYCVKNTFVQLEDEELKSLSPVAHPRRARSMEPPRLSKDLDSDSDSRETDEN